MSKPKIFIGSSSEGLNVAYAIQQNLNRDAEITVWDQGVFELSLTTIESLILILEQSDFAIFVFSPDDILKIREAEHLSVRDNVIFELGLFIGKLGRSRCFIIMPSDTNFHIPTDLIGITTGKYDSNRSDGSFQAATGPVCHQIRIQIRKMGLLVIPITESVNATDTDKVDNEIKEQKWSSLYVEGKFEEALKMIQDDIENANDQIEKSQLRYFQIYLNYKINPEEGKTIIQDLIKKEKNIKPTYLAVSRMYLWEDELDLALNIIDEGLKKFPNDDFLILRKAEYYVKFGKTSEAINLLSNEIFDDIEDIQLKLAELHETNEPPNVELAYDRILKYYKKNSSSETIIYKLAKLAHETEKDNVGLYLFDKLTTKYPSNVNYWGYLGNTYLNLGFYNLSMEAYLKADTLSNSEATWIIENLGNLFSNVELFSEARKYFDRALKLDPNSEYSFQRVGTIIKSQEEETKKVKKAIQEGLNSIFGNEENDNLEE